MTKKLNILVVTGFALDDPAGGVTTMIHTLTQGLAADCRVVTIENNWNASRLVRQESEGGVEYKLRFRCPYDEERPMRGFFGWCLSFVPTLLALRQLLREEQIDIIHAHYGAPYQYYFRLVRRFWGIPYIITLHRGDIMTYRNLRLLDRILFRYAISGAERVISVSRWLANQAVTTLGAIPQIGVIENGLGFEALDTMNDADFGSHVDFDVPQQFFLMVSNVTHYKAQDVAIRAWALVRAEHPHVPLLIVGGKRELWDECVRLIQEFDCGDDVRLLGAQPREVAVNLMRRATAIIIPSRSEGGFAYAVLEAGAVGTPMICSDIDPFTEVVEDGKTALITPVEDHEAIAAAVLRLLRDPALGRRIGKDLSQKIRSNRSASRMAAQYLTIYRGLVRS
jgi:glycosyltransferase involved in cell wall biosynthesis